VRALRWTVVLTLYFHASGGSVHLGELWARSERSGGKCHSRSQHELRNVRDVNEPDDEAYSKLLRARKDPSSKATFRRDVSLLLVAPTTFEEARLASMRSQSRKGESRASRFLVIESTPSGRSRGDIILSSFLMVGDLEACEWSGRAFVYPLSASIESPVGVGHFRD